MLPLAVAEIDVAGVVLSGQVKVRAGHVVHRLDLVGRGVDDADLRDLRVMVEGLVGPVIRLHQLALVQRVIVAAVH
jgi:hypothetical protein